jgi:hypothetical protein
VGVSLAAAAADAAQRVSKFERSNLHGCVALAASARR